MLASLKAKRFDFKAQISLVQGWKRMRIFFSYCKLLTYLAFFYASVLCYCDLDLLILHLEKPLSWLQ